AVRINMGFYREKPRRSQRKTEIFRDDERIRNDGIGFMSFKRQLHILLIICIYRMIVQVMHLQERKHRCATVCDFMRKVMFYEIRKFNHLPHLSKRKKINGSEPVNNEPVHNSNLRHSKA